MHKWVYLLINHRSLEISKSPTPLCAGLCAQCTLLNCGIHLVVLHACVLWLVGPLPTPYSMEAGMICVHGNI